MSDSLVLSFPMRFPASLTWLDYFYRDPSKLKTLVGQIMVERVTLLCIVCLFMIVMFHPRLSVLA